MELKPTILFGGTFDPVHVGHITIANQLYNTFNTPITFLPTGIPPYKAKPTISSEVRLTMLKLAINGSNCFNIDYTEIKNDKFCYSYKTLTEIRKKVAINTHISFVVGSDSLISLDKWDNWKSLFGLTNFIIVKRPKYDINSVKKELKNELQDRINKSLQEFYQAPYGNVFIVDNNSIDVSSTQIRQYIKKHLAFEHLVPKKVAQYIKKNKLYI